MGKGIPRNGVNKGWFKKGRVFTTEEKQKIREATKKAQEHYRWKGDNIKYAGLHDWVILMLGQPTKCKKCGTDGLVGHKIHWANRSGEYKREISDWLRLCVKCHSRYDKIKKFLMELQEYEKD